jgi:NTP pyrophosphatase (non-canonical NTP hydrolase)
METPETVGTWVQEVFPEWSGAKGRALAVIEEAVELGQAAGLTEQQIQSAVNLSFNQHRSRTAQIGYVPESDEGEVADCMLNIFAYAYQRGIDPQAALDKKMTKNRAKPIEQYRAKTALKKMLGLALDTL